MLTVAEVNLSVFRGEVKIRGDIDHAVDIIWFDTLRFMRSDPQVS